MVNPYSGCLDDILFIIEQQQNSFDCVEISCSLDEGCSSKIVDAVVLNSKMSEIPSLRKLAVQSSKLSANAFARLSQLIKRSSASIEVCIFDSLSNVTDRKFAEFLRQSNILAHPQLSRLRICDCLIGYHSVKSIADSVDLTLEQHSPVSMDFSGCILSKSAVQLLAELIQNGFPLQGLILNQNPVHNDGAMVLGNSLRNKLCQLQTLQLVNCSIKSSGGNSIMSSLETNQSLTLLNLSDNILNDDHSHQFGSLCGAVLSSNSTLTSLNLSHTLLYTITDDFKEGLTRNQSLTHISFANNRLGPAGLRQVLQVLSENNIISSMDLSGTRLTEEVVLEMLLILEKREKKLKLLDVRLNHIPKDSQTVKELSSLVGCLKFHTTNGQLIGDGQQEF